jgi:hypothetical protein
MMNRSLIVFFLVFLPSTAALALTDRAHLEKWCTHSSQVAAGRCIGYLLAAEDVLATQTIDGVQACLPRDVTLQQQHQTVIDWLEAHPDTGDATAMALVSRAYAERFPCKK